MILGLVLSYGNKIILNNIEDYTILYTSQPIPVNSFNQPTDSSLTSAEKNSIERNYLLVAIDSYVNAGGSKGLGLAP